MSFMDRSGIVEHGQLSPAKTPILPLTSVRIFAALYVVLHHCILWTGGFQVSTWFGRFVRDGYTAVGFFFTLSGYILAHVYLNTDRPLNARVFWTSRFARVYPLLFASLLLDAPRDFIIRVGLHGTFNGLFRGIVALFTEIFLLQAWSGIFRNINAPSWSLSAEAFFYLAFPFIAVYFWRWRRGGASALFFVLWFAAMVTPTLVTVRHPELFIQRSGSGLQESIELMPIFRIVEFLTGISLCAMQQSLLRRWSLHQRDSFAYAALAAACALFILAIQFSNQVPILLMSDGLLLPVYGLTILGLVNLRGPLQHLLSQPAFVLLGEASYAVYLLHAPLFSILMNVYRVNNAFFWVLYIALVMIVSILSYYLLERPARSKILSLAKVKPSVTLSQETVGRP